MRKEKKKPELNGGADHLLFKNAYQLRENMTEAEEILWEELRLKRLDGFKFRRQHPIGIYILDFFCFNKKLGIEIDGGYHETEEQTEADKYRSKILHKQGIQIIRFTNEQVLNNINFVCEKIKQTIKQKDL